MSIIFIFCPTYINKFGSSPRFVYVRPLAECMALSAFIRALCVIHGSRPFRSILRGSGRALNPVQWGARETSGLSTSLRDAARSLPALSF